MEFLYKCVLLTVEKTIPEEVSYLQKYDLMKGYLDDHFEMPDQIVALLVRFLEQNNGELSEKAKTKEFQKLNNEEINLIENKYKEIFG